MRLSNKEVKTEYGKYEIYLYKEECKIDGCTKCLNSCEFGYKAKEINGEVSD